METDYYIAKVRRPRTGLVKTPVIGAYARDLLIILALLLMAQLGAVSGLAANNGTTSYFGTMKTVSLPETGVTIHCLKKGETLYYLSQVYFVTVPVLLKTNQIRNPKRLTVGTPIRIPPVDYKSDLVRTYQVTASDTANGLMAKYNLQSWQFKRLNPGTALDKIAPGTVVFLPRELPNRAQYSAHFPRLIIPVRGLISSRYGFRWGRMHYGLDLAAPTGSRVYAAATGKVIYAGWLGSYGLLVKVDHGQYITYYGHLSRILVNRGDRVGQGDCIARVGATGRAYGSHLHFEVESNGRKLNPVQFLVGSNS